MVRNQSVEGERKRGHRGDHFYAIQRGKVDRLSAVSSRGRGCMNASLSTKRGRQEKVSQTAANSKVEKEEMIIRRRGRLIASRQTVVQAEEKKRVQTGRSADLGGRRKQTGEGDDKLSV